MSRTSWHLRANALVGAWLVAAVLGVLAHRWLPAAEWLMVHLLMLGAVSTAILVWSQHFADTLLRRPAVGGRRGQTARLAAHTVGSVLVVAGLVTAVWPLVVAGGVLVVSGVLAQVAVIAVQARQALPSRFGHMVRYYLAAGLVLPVGVVLGVLMARGDLADEPHGRLYIAHVALNLLGWVGLTVLGTLVVLWPTVLHARIEPAAERGGRIALPVALVGLGIVVAASATGWRGLVPVGCVVFAAALGIVLQTMATQARSAPPSTCAGWMIGAAVLWLVGSTLAYGAVVVFAPSWTEAAERVRGLVAPFAVGFAAQVLVGSLSYLLPVVLGGGPSVARRTSAELDRGGVVRAVVVNAGLLLFVAPVPSSVRVVASFAVLGGLATFLVLAARAVLAARRPSATTSTAATTPVVATAAPGARRSPSGQPQAAALTPGAPTASAAVPARSRSGALAVAVGVVALTVVAGVAVDPPAAGLGIVQQAAENPAMATGRTTTVAVEAQDMRFVPDRIAVPAGDRLLLEITNTDTGAHDLVLATGATSGRMAPDESVQVDVGVVTADLDGWCSVAGHRLMGMTLTIDVVGEVATVAAGPTESPATSDPHAGHSMGPAADPAVVDPTTEPPDTFTARDATLAAAGAGPRTHRQTLTVTEVERSVAPGVTQRLWTFGGQAPGPVLRGSVGDTFEITLVNDGTIGHSVDFHAGALAPDDVMRTIAPGESLTYTFTATRSGIWMYHCSSMPMSVHIANGMFGAVVIDPPGLPPVDREYVLVQSELYLGPQGGEVDADKVAATDPDLVVFNGYANQYKFRPLTAKAGERVRFWVLDAGPNKASSFHVVGTQFDTVYREGDWVLRDGGSTGTGGAQVLSLAPAEGGFVELTFPEAGTYPFVTHAMSDAESGAVGRVVVTDR